MSRCTLRYDLESNVACLHEREIAGTAADDCCQQIL